MSVDYEELKTTPILYASKQPEAVMYLPPIVGKSSATHIAICLQGTNYKVKEYDYAFFPTCKLQMDKNIRSEISRPLGVAAALQGLLSTDRVLLARHIPRVWLLEQTFLIEGRSEGTVAVVEDSPGPCKWYTQYTSPMLDLERDVVCRDVVPYVSPAATIDAMCLNTMCGDPVSPPTKLWIESAYDTKTASVLAANDKRAHNEPRQPIQLDYKEHSRDRIGPFDFDCIKLEGADVWAAREAILEAELGGIIPLAVIRALIGPYSRGPAAPRGLDSPVWSIPRDALASLAGLRIGGNYCVWMRTDAIATFKVHLALTPLSLLTIMHSTGTGVPVPA